MDMYIYRTPLDHRKRQVNTIFLIISAIPHPVQCDACRSGSSRHLRHFPYLQLLPPQGDLMTAVYFTQEELECFRGTNLYGACNDRLRDWQTEWAHCREVVSQSKPDWGIQFEWFVSLLFSLKQVT